MLQGTPSVQFDNAVVDGLVHQIAQENTRVHIALYSFTDSRIAKALLAAKKRGVDVQVIVDKASIKTKSPLQRLQKQGIFIDVWGSSRMHGAFCVFSNLVWIGSLDAKVRAADSMYAALLDDGVSVALFEKKFWALKQGACSYTDYKEKRERRPSETIDAVAVHLDVKTSQDLE